MAAYLFLAQRRRIRQMTDQLALQTMAARGDPAVVKKQLRDWERS
jgi:hypothetical protein